MIEHPWRARICASQVCVIFFLIMVLAPAPPRAWAETGQDWTLAPATDPQYQLFTGGRACASSCVYNNKMWMIGGGGSGGATNDVWSSDDGLHWTLVTGVAGFSARTYHQSVVCQGKMWVIGGWDGTIRNDVWSSSNGINWNEETSAANFPARNQGVYFSYNNKLWLIGGALPGNIPANDVWNTSDGKVWSLVTAAAQFSPRAEMRGVVFNGKMWIIGGYTRVGGSPIYLNDVWWSTDGIDWTETTADAGFSGRWAHSVTATETTMYVIGGCGGAEATNLNKEIWSSTTGSTWTQINGNAAFTPRFYTESQFFANRLWLLGGRVAGGWTVAPDYVWFSDVPLVPVEMSHFSLE